MFKLCSAVSRVQFEHNLFMGTGRDDDGESYRRQDVHTSSGIDGVIHARRHLLSSVMVVLSF